MPVHRMSDDYDDGWEDGLQELAEPLARALELIVKAGTHAEAVLLARQALAEHHERTGEGDPNG